jgi:hypothetical protein
MGLKAVHVVINVSTGKGIFLKFHYAYVSNHRKQAKTPERL